MDWCDYIVVAVTSSDFPVNNNYILILSRFEKELIYENKRRYISASEENIDYILVGGDK